MNENPIKHFRVVNKEMSMSTDLRPFSAKEINKLIATEKKRKKEMSKLKLNKGEIYLLKKNNETK